jgi:hypothetical protein
VGQVAPRKHRAIRSRCAGVKGGRLPATALASASCSYWSVLLERNRRSDVFNGALQACLNPRPPVARAGGP